MQKISRRKLAEHIADQLNAGANTQQLVNQTVAYLQEQRQLGQWELLLRDVEDVLAAKYSTVSVHITSARQLDAGTSTKLIDFIKQAEDAKSVVVTSETVDTELIGGAIVRTPSNVFDSSVRSKLKQLVATTKG